MKITSILLAITALVSAEHFQPPVTPPPSSLSVQLSAAVDIKIREHKPKVRKGPAENTPMLIIQQPHKVTRTVTVTKTICPIEITRLPPHGGHHGGGGGRRTWVFIGCLGSNNGHKDFTLQSTDPQMEPERCHSDCDAAGFEFAGLYMK